MSRGLKVVLFAGAGGTCTGIEAALGEPVDVAINHSAVALAVHKANHPGTRHLRGDVWSYAPLDVTGGEPVDFLWASPTCTFFSRAKGKPLDRALAMKVRSLAWVVNRWAREAKPRIIMLENVEAFQDWGPLLRDGTRCPDRRGATFRRWVSELKRAGYVVEWREMSACDYGAPTSRKRLFVVARRDGEPIRWPVPTHGPGLIPYRAAAEVIDWTLPVPSVFDRKKPLTSATLRRIARGMEKFVLAGDPYMVGPELAATLIQRGYGERQGQDPRCLDIRKPLGTIVAGGIKHALVVAFIAKHFGGNGSPGQSLRSPLGTVTCKDHHALVVASGLGHRHTEVRQLLSAYGSTKRQGGLFDVSLEIADIGMRWLTPRELAGAQGFPADYVLDPIMKNGKPLGTTAQVMLVGNSVSPFNAEALVRANISAAESEAA
ncbi:MAG TPA: DNA cytosine methyltransferase [Polyangiaceae bacterium]